MDFSDISVAVIGDAALDFYYFACESGEISVETGLPINYIKKYSYGPGGAGNLACNIAVLGAKCDLYGACGNDIWADILKGALKDYGVNTDGFTGSDGFDTFVYHKIYDESDSELPRYDLGAENIYTDEHLDAILDKLRRNLNKYDAIVVNSQFSNTLHNAYFRKHLSEILENAKVPVWIDSRTSLMYPNASYKMNISEAQALSGKDKPGDCLKALYAVYKKSSRRPGIVITLGADGAIGYDGKDVSSVSGINAIWPMDTVGAGDAFLSGLVCMLASGKSLSESLPYANASAAVSTKTLRATGHPKPFEIDELLADPDYRYNGALSKDLRLAKYLPETEIEIINPESKGFGKPDACIFDHDGTVSVMRFGWEKIMRRCMLEAILGDELANVPHEKIEQIYEDIDAVIDRTTGIQTIIQMQMLEDMVRRYGYVTGDRIKTASEYKKIYLIALNDAVEKKYERIRRGINCPDDFMMKSALDFIKSLKDEGVKTYLASGTDFDDVKKETDCFGTSGLFTGGIFGSVGDISNDPKKVVMGNIIKELSGGKAGKKVIVFGDGPVEIREGKKNGFLTVGVLSNEAARFGLNLNKRERLVLAGADVLIPDFSWIPLLKDYLKW